MKPIGNIGYGGSERVVESLVRGFASVGYKPYLFAAADSSQEIKSLCHFFAVEPTSLRHIAPFATDILARESRTAFSAMKALRLAKKLGLDFIINHMGIYALAPYAMMEHPLPMATVLHGYMGREADTYLLPELKGHPVISISNDQRTHLPDLNYIATVYNPIPDTFTLREEDDHDIVLPSKVNLPAGSYLTWVGRFSKDKRPHLAIDIAAAAQMPIVLAGKRELHEGGYWETEIAPRLAQHGELIKFIGEVNDSEKDALMGGAVASLMPINWQEPFGLVVPESMNTGTPVIATRMGSMPELIEEGRTGFLVPNFADEAKIVSACKKKLALITTIDRRECRETARKRFGIAKATEGYITACLNQLVAERRIKKIA